MRERKWSAAKVAQLMTESGRPASRQFIKDMLARRRRPSWDFAADLAALFEREITAETIMRYGTTEDGRSVAPPNKKKAAA